MSQPRQIVPGATYLLTRRALRRHMLFRPDVVITQLVLYALAVSARRYGLHLHALCLMSTHLSRDKHAKDDDEAPFHASINRYNLGRCRWR